MAKTKPNGMWWMAWDGMGLNNVRGCVWMRVQEKDWGVQGESIVSYDWKKKTNPPKKKTKDNLDANRMHKRMSEYAIKLIGNTEGAVYMLCRRMDNNKQQQQTKHTPKQIVGKKNQQKNHRNIFFPLFPISSTWIHTQHIHPYIHPTTTASTTRAKDVCSLHTQTKNWKISQINNGG